MASVSLTSSNLWLKSTTRNITPLYSNILTGTIMQWINIQWGNLQLKRFPFHSVLPSLQPWELEDDLFMVLLGFLIPESVVFLHVSFCPSQLRHQRCERIRLFPDSKLQSSTDLMQLKEIKTREHPRQSKGEYLKKTVVPCQWEGETLKFDIKQVDIKGQISSMKR